MIYSDRKADLSEKKAKKTIGKFFSAKDIDPTILATLTYEYPGRKIWVEMATAEFTCVCPFSELPDFALLKIKYIPHKRLVEMKSLKYYLFSYRSVKIYNEHVVNKILEDLVKVLNPREMNIIAEFTSRGGITNKVEANYKK